MKETKTKKSTYLRNFIIAVTLSVAILAAGALWVLLGWRSALDITLTDLAGDPAALRGHETVMVTTRDIDAQIRELARVIGYGIDLALQPLDFSELCALMG